MTNGTGKTELIDVEMADGSASEESSEPEVGHEEDFLDEEQDYDPSTPYLPILEQLDVPFGLAVSSVSVPAIPYSIQSAEFKSLPKIAQQHIIITVVCADNSIRIITLPLLPPHPRTRKRMTRIQKGKSYVVGTGLWGEKVYFLQGTTTHQTLPKGISVVLVPRNIEQSADLDPDREDESQTGGGASGASGLWDFVVASHSHDLTGVLRIHKIGLPSKGLDLRGENGSATMNWLWREQRLQRPARSIHLYASQKTVGSNPSVLVAEPNGAVRTYSCDPASPLDSGTWGIAIFPDLEAADPAKTKSLLDAKLVLGGNAIAIVTSESTWALYDLKHITGAMPTKAVATGSIGKSVVGLDGNTAGSTKLGSKMAPMTPGTRRVRQEKLFARPSQKLNMSPHGGISVTSTSDSMTVWHGDRMSTISNLQGYLNSTLQELRNPLAAMASHQIRELNLTVNGPSLTSLAVIASPHNSTRECAVQSDVLVTGQRSMTIVTPPMTGPPAQIRFSAAAAEDDAVEQKLLTRGDLSIEGVDRMLARLEADKGIKTGEDLFSRVKNKGKMVLTNGTNGR